MRRPATATGATYTNTPDEVARDRERWLSFGDVCDICREDRIKAAMAYWAPIPGTPAAADTTWDQNSIDCNNARDQYIGTCRECNDRIRGAVAQHKAEILYDIAQGTVPAAVASFSELHDYVDANEYGFADGDDGEDWTVTLVAEIQDRVDAWLKAGRQ